MFNKLISTTLLIATMVVGALSSSMLSPISVSAASGVNPGFYNPKTCPIGEYIEPTSTDLVCQICPVDSYCTIDNVAGPDGTVFKYNGIVQPKNVRIPCGYVYNGSTFATTQLLKADGTPDTRPRSTIASDGVGTTSRVVNINEIVNGVSTKVGQRTEPLTGENNGKGASSANQCIVKNATPCANGQYGNSIDGCTPCPDGSATQGSFTSTIRACVCPSGRLLIERLLNKDFKCAVVPCPQGYVQNLADKFAPDYCEKLVCDNGATNPVQCNVCPTGKINIYNGIEDRYKCEIPAKLSGYVYVDSNDNGIKDANEAPIANVKVALTCRAINSIYSIVRETTTDANGYYEFNNLGPCNYTLNEFQPAGYLDGKDSAGTGATQQGSVGNDSQTGIKISAGDNSINNNFGEKTTVVISSTPSSVANSSAIPANGTISGYVLIDGTNTPIAGTTVTLVSTCTNNGTTSQINIIRQTDANGFYSFTNLPLNCTYTVTETQPTGYNDSRDVPGINSTLTSNDVFQVSLTSSVSNSPNNNFYENNKVVTSSSTATSSVVVSSSVVSSSVASSTISSTPVITSSSTVTSSSAIPANGTISGYVLIDGTNTPIAGTTVTLVSTCTNNGTTSQINIIRQTDANGFYSFTNLPLNCTYTVTETQPKEFDDSRETAGPNSIVKSNDVFEVSLTTTVSSSPNNNFYETKKTVASTPTPQSGGSDNSTGLVLGSLAILGLGIWALSSNNSPATPTATTPAPEVPVTPAPETPLIPELKTPTVTTPGACAAEGCECTEKDQSKCPVRYTGTKCTEGKIKDVNNKCVCPEGTILSSEGFDFTKKCIKGGLNPSGSNARDANNGITNYGTNSKTGQQCNLDSSDAYCIDKANPTSGEKRDISSNLLSLSTNIYDSFLSIDTTNNTNDIFSFGLESKNTLLNNDNTNLTDFASLFGGSLKSPSISTDLFADFGKSNSNIASNNNFDIASFFSGSNNIVVSNPSSIITDFSFEKSPTSTNSNLASIFGDYGNTTTNTKLDINTELFSFGKSDLGFGTSTTAFAPTTDNSSNNSFGDFFYKDTTISNSRLDTSGYLSYKDSNTSYFNDNNAYQDLSLASNPNSSYEHNLFGYGF